MRIQKAFLILYEDDFIVAMDKPPRMASVPAENILLYQTALGKIQRQFEEKGIKPYLLHRLDYETSGVLLFGKFPRDRTALESIFNHPETRKKYVALVKGNLHGGSITKKLLARNSKEEIAARTDFRVLKIFRAPHPICTLIEAEIKTGRKHQIRRHFAEIDCQIILDSRYGDFHFNRKFRLRYRLGRLFLHAASIEFFHPLLKKTIRIEAALPPDLQSVLKKLSFGR